MERVSVVVTPARRLGRVDDRVFGSFIENLGRCIYGGVFDPTSPVADASGFRTDVIDAARAMGVSNVRFPGGSFAPYYHWRDGVGSLASRPETRYRADGEWPTSNAFGTDEFISWCRRLGAAPYICVNMGSGTPEEARDWVEYCNAPIGSRWADLRAANGHADPYGVRLWALGNEISAPWEFGYTKTAAQYVARARDFATAMKAADPTIELVVSGAHFPIDFPERDWNRDVLDGLHDVADFISGHHYIGHDYKDRITDEWQELGPSVVHERLVEWMQLLDDALVLIESDIRLIGHERTSRRSIGIAVDEFNAWYKTSGGADELVERYPVADGLLIASYFNMFIRHAGAVRLCNMAQLVNTLPAIVVRSGGIGSYRQSISFVQEVFQASRCGESIDVWADSPRLPGRYYESLSLLDVSAVLSADGTEIVLNVTNHDPHNDYDLDVAVAGRRVGPWTGVAVGGRLDDANDFEHPLAVSIVDRGRGTVVPRASHTVLRSTVVPPHGS